MKRWRWAVIGAALLSVPSTCMVSQPLACHQPRTFLSGTHLGYRIGMTRAEAVNASASFPFSQRLFVIWDKDEIRPNTSAVPRHERFPRSFADLRASGWRNEEWLINRGQSWCFFSENDTRLIFQDARLHEIRDELGYNGP